MWVLSYYSSEIKRELSAWLSAWVSIYWNQTPSASHRILCTALYIWNIRLNFCGAMDSKHVFYYYTEIFTLTVSHIFPLLQVSSGKYPRLVEITRFSGKSVAFLQFLFIWFISVQYFCGFWKSGSCETDWNDCIVL